MVEAGRELNRRPYAEPTTGKVLDSAVKPGTFGDFPEDQIGPKTAQEDPNNPRKTGPRPVDRK
jgi:hypothetical protein